ncbi:multidrug efflux MFS transporter [Starkeya sp. ORNL1]|uniref:DHA2 family efflux MFS transporter permease subunit n=1 Tax=Starkeya sp. ORNL1 TaxID=2709380 RepID=UPI0014636B74|nr:DHA2 family efflux MFS transporter permease subunit [Starkeya sp. ORNL1]QJP14787.1 multidrug efflux MFS transporter [Starkeya sp. ORNL1]
MSVLMESNAAADGRRALTVAALAATYIQAVNVSLPNAALLHIQGTLSMADDEAGWVFSSYLAASIVTMPLAHWLASRYGRKAVYQVSIVVFALGLVLATRADTSLQFIAARFVQGGASGILAPLSLAILLDIAPPVRRAGISLVWTVISVLGIVSGPSIGGWLCEYHDWRLIFYVSLPIAGLISFTVALTLREKRVEQTLPFDFFGLAAFSLGLIGLQLLLDRGERMEWFNSAEIWAEATASALGFYLYFVHVLTAKVHYLDKALFKDRNFIISTIMYFAVGLVLLPTMALTSPMLDELLGYPADTTGYMAIPRSIALVGALILTVRIPARIDKRLLVAVGLVLVIYANWRMLGYSPAMDWRPVIVAGVFQGAGLGILLPALTNTAFATLDPAFRADGTMLFNLSRLYGSTIGIALVQIFFYDTTQAMHLALAKNLTPFRAAAHPTGEITGPALATLNHLVTHQAAFVGIIDQFELMMIAMLIVSPLVLLLRNPRLAT